ncbi:MAG TPA: PAS domain-containing protein, partial [Mycobacterium sp.]|nr:PAS domain-containing protein [Mycobacterium sp.]
MTAESPPSSAGAGAPDLGVPAVVLLDGKGLVASWNTGAGVLLGVTAQEALGRRVRELPVSFADDDVAADVRGHWEAGSAWEGTCRIRRRDGTTVDTQMVVDRLAVTSTAHISTVIVAVDRAGFEGNRLERLSKVIAAERAARDAGRSADRWWSELRQAADTAVTSDSLDTLLREALAAIRNALGSHTASILLANDDGDELVVRASIGFPALVNRGLHIPYGAGMAGAVMASGQVQVFDDLTRVNVVSSDLRTAGLRS